MDKNVKAKIKIIKNGPYIVSGNLPLRQETPVLDKEGIPVSWQKGDELQHKENYSLCRCGKSKNMPFCDNTHTKTDFDGTESARNIPYEEQAAVIKGPGLVLKDAESFCSIAMFCHRAGDAWTLTENSGNEECKATAIQEACDCPSGRLVACHKDTGKPIEPYFTQSISVTEDPCHKVSGPLWVKGGVPIESENGTVYEVRNRVTLCRCGKSKNKPFCDGSHIHAKFKA